MQKEPREIWVLLFYAENIVNLEKKLDTKGKDIIL